MTDPNVLKALKELADAVAWSVPSGLDDNLVKARRCLDRAFTLLAAAEKPAECAGCNGRGEVGGPLRDGSTQTDACSFCAGTGRAEKPAEVERCPNHHKDGRCSLDDGHAGDHVAKWGDTGAEIARWPRRLSDLGRDAEKPAEAAPVAPLPWVVRLKEDGRVMGAFRRESHANEYAAEFEPGTTSVSKVAAAPTVAAVNFDGTDWVTASRERLAPTDAEYVPAARLDAANLEIARLTDALHNVRSRAWSHVLAGHEPSRRTVEHIDAALTPKEPSDG